MEKLRICLGGDIVPTKVNKHLFINGDGQKLLGSKLMDILSVSDANIFNLETPLCDGVTPIVKCGPNLQAPSDCVKGFQSMLITAVGCANNHILDYGEKGMLKTKELLAKYNIDVFGIGTNLSEAVIPYIIEKKGKRVGIYACAEHEFTIATDKRSGANPYDALYSFDHVAELKSSCDYVIVMFHGGKEYYRYPSPNVQRICRRFVEKGADLVVTQHTHCIGCQEYYRDGLIIYGQGNFIFDQFGACDQSFFGNGLLLQIIVGDEIEINLLPVILNKKGCLTLAEEHKRDEIINGFLQRSQKITEEDFIFKNYNDFARKNIEKYLRVPLGFISTNLLMRCFNSLLGRKIFFMFTNKKHRLSILNNMECESHRELFIRGLKDILNI